MADTAAKSTTPKRKPAAGSAVVAAPEAAAAGASTSEARSRFNAALDEARAGAVALKSEARDKANAYGSQARERSEDWVAEAKTKAGELAVEGKARASEAISGLARVIDDNAGTIDEKLGARYGDYARTASKTLGDTASKLDQKSLDELGADARELVRKSPAAAVGLAALAGFLVARILRRK
ncbi:MAG: hypothetical protein B7Z08_02470 [Sphingomonadales bacterium 32-68-7]|nr:MAG: hypothetical protein B7Z33_02910 [Sphingomonadales bacterium 12-68-11]OYX10104.1 MAG: hypothetical protein B7Z08_02470 [Sphingomonadales bacterium 32-68-7]